MDLNRIGKERAAVAAYGDWLEHLEETLRKARDLRQTYRDAGMPIPPSLASFLASPDEANESERPRMVVTPPVSPPRPTEAGTEWIWLPVAEANLTSIVLCVLHHMKGVPQTPAEVYRHVLRMQPDANEGSMLNIGARLDGKQIIRTDTGWMIGDKTKSPVEHKWFVWGPVDVFQAQEVAAHRRLLVLHVLSAAGVKGLGTMDITRHLQASDYCHAPVSKDLIKMDLIALEGAKKARQVRNSRNWTVVREETA